MILKQISKRFMERLLEAEMTHHLGNAKHSAISTSLEEADTVLDEGCKLVRSRMRSKKQTVETRPTGAAK